jgi:hypothetical protein
VTSIPTEQLAHRIASLQQIDGSFPSLVLTKGKQVRVDHNACITGLVVRALRREGPSSQLHRARERALDYLEDCERSALPNAFGFWPERTEPGRPGDADDTSIAAMELYRHGRRSRDWLRNVALRVLMAFRVQPSEEVKPEWVRVGAFLTWLRPSPANVVDALVNANVAALFALAQLRHVLAYSAAVTTVNSAIAWTKGSVQRTRMIAPYYAHPGEFFDALAHALDCGAIELQPAANLLREWFRRDESLEEDRPVCCAPYGETIWTAPVLQLARQISNFNGLPGPGWS